MTAYYLIIKKSIDNILKGTQSLAELFRSLTKF
uniref:Uncharacterized protein n=1 Tax=Anguilla anguilla TaxID=7936 RepID=A0A0E9V317_ANGAN